MSTPVVREWSETVWGIVREGLDGEPYVETAGTKPDGSVGPFTEAECRYMARSNRYALVRREVRHSRVELPWEDVEL